LEKSGLDSSMTASGEIWARATAFKRRTAKQNDNVFIKEGCLSMESDAASQFRVSCQH
jgi:hypothetical protein